MSTTTHPSEPPGCRTARCTPNRRPPTWPLRPPRSSSWRTALPACGVAELKASLGLAPPVAKVEAAPVAEAAEEPVDEVDAETAPVDADADTDADSSTAWSAS
jgi:hypothetical protein